MKKIFCDMCGAEINTYIGGYRQFNDRGAMLQNEVDVKGRTIRVTASLLVLDTNGIDICADCIKQCTDSLLARYDTP